MSANTFAPLSRSAARPGSLMPLDRRPEAWRRPEFRSTTIDGRCPHKAALNERVYADLLRNPTHIGQSRDLGN
jgi:hypothetical protein